MKVELKPTMLKRQAGVRLFRRTSRASWGGEQKQRGQEHHGSSLPAFVHALFPPARDAKAAPCTWLPALRKHRTLPCSSHELLGDIWVQSRKGELLKSGATSL